MPWKRRTSRTDTLRQMPLDYVTPSPLTDLASLEDALLPSAASAVETCAVGLALIGEPDDAWLWEWRQSALAPVSCGRPGWSSLSTA
jgi:hypothetical protein